MKAQGLHPEYLDSGANITHLTRNLCQVPQSPPSTKERTEIKPACSLRSSASGVGPVTRNFGEIILSTLGHSCLHWLGLVTLKCHLRPTEVVIVYLAFKGVLHMVVLSTFVKGLAGRCRMNPDYYITFVIARGGSGLRAEGR